MMILGVSAYYHDSAAAIVRDGEILAAAQEERFTRKKHDSGLPVHAILYCLKEAQAQRGGIDIVAFYDKPITKFTRLLTTYVSAAPKGLESFLDAVPLWVRSKAWIGLQIEDLLAREGYGRPGDFHFVEHHQSHAASAFFPSPNQRAAVVTTDGVGEWACSSISSGEENRLEMLCEQHFPHSLGLFYSAMTYFTGFKVNSGEYKLMGLAPYGEPRYVDQIKKHLIDIREDGSVWLNMEYFDFLGGLKMTNAKFSGLFGGPPRNPESEITRREMDLAASTQQITEEAMLNMARFARAITGQRHLCLAGGVALNCVANGKILRERIFDAVWVQPAAGDAGGALGAALFTWYQTLGNIRVSDGESDAMKGAALGPGFDSDQIREFLDRNGIPYVRLDQRTRNRLIATRLTEDRVVAVLQGRMEFGPRALGFRSILADARSRKVQSYLNLATKFRESFRPFAPIVLAEDVSKYFELDAESPYMLLVAQVRSQLCYNSDHSERSLSLAEWVNRPRSELPAITHVDYSARIQTVDARRNPVLYDIMREFKQMTGCSVLVNTSFNVRSEPIVCTPEDAYRCFMRTGIDTLVLEDCVLDKSEQPEWHETTSWK